MIAVVLGFRSSSNLAAAYGVAVTSTMGITTLLLYVVARRLWGWTLVSAVLVTAVLLAVDLAFLGANLVKVVGGGWFPLGIAGGVYVTMATWRRGRELLARRLREKMPPLDEFVADVVARPRQRVPGVAIFLSGHAGTAPPAFVHAVLRVDQLAMILDDGIDALRRRFLIAAEENDEIAPRHELLLLEAQERRSQTGDTGFVVGAAAAKKEPVLLDQRERIAFPVLAFRRDDVHVRQEQDGLAARAVAAVAHDHRRGFADGNDVNVRFGKSSRAELAGEIARHLRHLAGALIGRIGDDGPVNLERFAFVRCGGRTSLRGR